MRDIHKRSVEVQDPQPGFSRYALSCGLLLIPAIAWNLAFTSKLMPAPAMAEFWRDIPAPLVLIENALRVLVFALPFVMPIQITTKRDRRADADSVLRGRYYRHRRYRAASGQTHPECRDHHLSDWGAYLAWPR